MRPVQWSLLIALSFTLPLLQAQEIAPQSPSSQIELEQRLSENEAKREALKSDIGATTTTTTEDGHAQLARLRQENQRLRMQLEQAQPSIEPQLLNDGQQWFAVGGGVGVLGFLLGVLTTRGRRRRQWLN